MEWISHQPLLRKYNPTTLSLSLSLSLSSKKLTHSFTGHSCTHHHLPQVPIKSTQNKTKQK